MPQKLYLDAEDLLTDAFKLGAMIVKNKFQPDFIIAIWRGGVPVGIAVQEMLACNAIKTDHIAIRTSSYQNSIDQKNREVRVHGLRYLVDRVKHTDRVLFVDDVYDTGMTIQKVIEKLTRKAKLNTPDEIRVAVPWYKPDRNLSNRVPDYYLHETNQWIKFPHSLEGLTPDEIQQYRSDIWQVLHE